MIGFDEIEGLLGNESIEAAIGDLASGSLDERLEMIKAFWTDRGVDPDAIDLFCKRETESDLARLTVMLLLGKSPSSMVSATVASAYETGLMIGFRLRDELAKPPHPAEELKSHVVQMEWVDSDTGDVIYKLLIPRSNPSFFALAPETRTWMQSRNVIFRSDPPGSWSTTREVGIYEWSPDRGHDG